jgi:hypothetical protein
MSGDHDVGRGESGRAAAAGAALRADLVPDEPAVLPELDGAGADRATSAAVLTGEPRYPPANWRRVRFTRNCRRPGRQRYARP